MEPQLDLHLPDPTCDAERYAFKNSHGGGIEIEHKKINWSLEKNIPEQCDIFWCLYLHWFLAPRRPRNYISWWILKASFFPVTRTRYIIGRNLKSWQLVISAIRQQQTTIAASRPTVVFLLTAITITGNLSFVQLTPWRVAGLNGIFEYSICCNWISEACRKG